MDPMGHFHAWGFTPSLDLIELYRATWALKAQREGTQKQGNKEDGSKNTKEKREQKRPLNVLLMQVGDIRHVIKTIAQKRRHAATSADNGGDDDDDDFADRPVHFYIYDKPIENIARHMLLLSILLDWSIPLKRRVVTWLEAFGNTLLPERTSKYIARHRMRLVDFITSMGDDGEEETHSLENTSEVEKDGSSDTLNERRLEEQRQRQYAVRMLKQVIDLSHLKYKERDELEKQFLSWSHDSEFRVEEYREQRLRNYFGSRFDFRDNLIDWDYHMDILPYAGVIHAQHYRQWRNTGVAFEFGDATYTNPNRSLSSYAEGKEGGRHALRRGFWGDIICSPYHAVGTSAFTGDKTYLGTSKTQKENIDNTRKRAQEEYASGDFQKKTAAHDGYIGDDSVRAIFGIGNDQPTKQRTYYKEGINEQKAMEYARELFEIVHRHSGSEQFRHNSMEIAVYNVLSWMFEIETGYTYAMQQQHELYSGLGNSESTAQVDESLSSDLENKSGQGFLEHNALHRTRSIGNTLRSFRVIPFTGDFNHVLEKIEKHRSTCAKAGVPSGDSSGEAQEAADTYCHHFHGLFDIVVVGGRAARFLDVDPEKGTSEGPLQFTNILAPKATIIMETARNVLSMKKRSREAFEQNMIDVGLRQGFRLGGTDRVLSGDTFSAGSVTETSPQTQRPATDHLNQYGEHAAALQYVSTEILRHNHRSGDNPPGEHLVFEWDVDRTPSRKESYSRVQRALRDVSASKTSEEDSQSVE